MPGGPQAESQGQGRKDHSEESRGHCPQEKRATDREETKRRRGQTEKSCEKEIEGSAQAPVKVADEDPGAISVCVG